MKFRVTPGQDHALDSLWDEVVNTPGELCLPQVWNMRGQSMLKCDLEGGLVCPNPFPTLIKARSGVPLGEAMVTPAPSVGSKSETTQPAREADLGT